MAEVPRINHEIFAPLCPDCKAVPMVYVESDMSDQGGPPENTWLCSDPECGFAIEAVGPTKII